MSSNKKNFIGLAESLVDYGRTHGAAEIEVSITDGSEFTVNVRDQKVENLTEAGSKGMDIRVFVDGKAASASSSDFAEETLHRLIDNAVARAKLGGQDEYAGLPDLEKITADATSLKIFDPKILELLPEKKIAIAKQLEAIGMTDNRIKKSTGSLYGTYEFTQTLANSKGFSGSYNKTVVNCGVGFQCGEGENLFQDGWYEGAVNLDKLNTPEIIAAKAVNRVTRLIGARKVETQNGPVVTEPPMTAWLLGFLSECIGGVNIARKQSFLVDKLGGKIGSEQVTILDDGMLPRGRGSAPFDGEGVPSRRTPIIEKGVLKNYLLDTYYGRKLKLKSTGNASGVTNLYVAAGTNKPDDIIKSVDKGLLLTGTLGLGTVPTTGDISVGAFGMWIEKGQIAFPVAEITISGNLGELLKSVQMVGNDLDFHGRINGPTIKFAEMTIGGKAGDA